MRWPLLPRARKVPGKLIQDSKLVYRTNSYLGKGRRLLVRQRIDTTNDLGLTNLRSYT
jgi:hypothetical protein